MSTINTNYSRTSDAVDTWNRLFDSAGIDAKMSVDSVKNDGTFTITLSSKGKSVEWSVTTNPEIDPPVPLPGSLSGGEIDKTLETMQDALGLSKEEVENLKSALASLGVPTGNKGSISAMLMNIFVVLALLMEAAQKAKDSAREMQKAASNAQVASLKSQEQLQIQAANSGFSSAMAAAAMSMVNGVVSIVGAGATANAQFEASKLDAEFEDEKLLVDQQLKGDKNGLGDNPSSPMENKPPSVEQQSQQQNPINKNPEPDNLNADPEDKMKDPVNSNGDSGNSENKVEGKNKESIKEGKEVKEEKKEEVKEDKEVKGKAKEEVKEDKEVKEEKKEEVKKEEVKEEKKEGIKEEKKSDDIKNNEKKEEIENKKGDEKLQNKGKEHLDPKDKKSDDIKDDAKQKEVVDKSGKDPINGNPIQPQPKAGDENVEVVVEQSNQSENVDNQGDTKPKDANDGFKSKLADLKNKAGVAKGKADMLEMRFKGTTEILGAMSQIISAVGAHSKEIMQARVTGEQAKGQEAEQRKNEASDLLQDANTLLRTVLESVKRVGEIEAESAGRIQC